MILRALKTEFLTQLKEYPVVTVIGPRQSGKTTLVQTVLPNYGNEIDLLHKSGSDLIAVKVKSAATVTLRGRSSK